MKIIWKTEKRKVKDLIPRDSLGRFLPGIGWPKGIPKIKKICQICGSDFYRWPSQLKAKRIVCSKICYFKSKAGEKQRHLLRNGKFKQEVAQKISNSLIDKPQPWNENEKHHEWKGDKAGYISFHQWLRRKFGKADTCENQKCIYPRINANGKILRKPKRFDWALIHGEKHDHNRKHYIKLCVSCHRKYDLEMIEI